MVITQSPLPGTDSSRLDRLERRIVVLMMLVTALVITTPILYAAWRTPPGTRFLGVPYLTDDFCVYLSWMRQVADGHVLQRNLFTTDAQANLPFSLLFWFLGTLARVAHLPLAIAWHVVRVPAAMAVLWLIYRFYRLCLPGDRIARLIAFGFACFGNGIGWLWWQGSGESSLLKNQVDGNQPEAYTFLCLYTSTLFTVSLLFIVGALYAMLLGERTGKARFAVVAGLCGAVLGNIHSYDAIHVSIAWALFLVVWTYFHSGSAEVAGMWRRTLLAAVLMAPTMAWQYYIFTTNPVFHKRVDTDAGSQPFFSYVTGYGVVFLLAVAAAASAWRPKRRGPPIEDAEPVAASATVAGLFADRRTFAIVLCWATAGLAAIYIPVSFQRKLLMGEHVPLCLLAGAAASFYLRRLRQLPLRYAIAALLVLVSAVSNVLYLVRDIKHVDRRLTESDKGPYISDDLLKVSAWLLHNTPEKTGVLGFSNECMYIPGLTGRTVWVGHWSETPDALKRLYVYRASIDREYPEAKRISFLQSTHTQYLLYPTHPDGKYVMYSDDNKPYDIVDFVKSPPSYLSKVYSNNEYTLFHIDIQPLHNEGPLITGSE